ncbi:MAG: hypothetical protein H6672_06670 [Anaerolineaceae bacterium]|nr:hypothetical protein [Anaerolineaceae bacterium]
MRRKSALFILVIAFLLPGWVIIAQDNPDPCAPDTVISTFVEAANGMALDTWVAGYTASDCPAFSIDAASTLQSIYDTLQLKSFTSGTTGEECQPQTIVDTFGVAVTAGSVKAWQAGYQVAACPEYVAENVNALARVYETASLSYAPAGMGDVTYEGDVFVLQTVTADGIVENWQLDGISISGTTQKALENGLASAEFGALFIRFAEAKSSAIVPLYMFRSAERIAENRYTLSVADGATLVGEFGTSTIADTSGNELGPNTRESIILTTLPAALEGVETPPPDQVWTLSFGEQVFTVAQPRFALSARRTRSNCIGACGYTTTLARSTLGIQVTGNNEVTDAEFNTVTKVVFDVDRSISVTLPNGYELGGQLSLDSRQSVIYFVADVVDDAGQYSYTLFIQLTDRDDPVTLEQVMPG